MTSAFTKWILASSILNILLLWKRMTTLKGICFYPQPHRPTFFKSMGIRLYVRSGMRKVCIVQKKSRKTPHRMYLIQCKLNYIRRSRHISRLFWYQVCKNRIKLREFWLRDQRQKRFERLENRPFNCTQLSYLNIKCTLEWLILQSFKMSRLCSLWQGTFFDEFIHFYSFYGRSSWQSLLFVTGAYWQKCDVFGIVWYAISNNIGCNFVIKQPVQKSVHWSSLYHYSLYIDTVFRFFTVFRSDTTFGMYTDELPSRLQPPWRAF